MVQLSNGDPYDDEFADGEESITYAFDVTTAGAMVNLDMTGDGEHGLRHVRRDAPRRQHLFVLHLWQQ